MALKDLEMIFKFVGGLGMFLYGMNTMADGLQRSAGKRMKSMMGMLTNNRFVGLLVGIGVTAIIQSSSATTVMIVGFVNAGIMNLTQAVGVIMGANIGTTVTSWLVSMNEWGAVLKPEFFAPCIIGVGAFILMFSKSEKKKQAGEIAVGFGILFIGLSFMSGSITPYKDAPIFASAFRVLGSNPFLGVLVGMLVTAVIQSSSASVGILQTLAANGVVNWNSAIFITLGQNIGTCVTALISSAGAHKTAKRAAIVHLLFNTIGAVVFGIIMFVVFKVNSALAASSISSVQISIFHTVFNISNTLLLFPFAKGLVKLSGLIIREDKKPETKDMLDEVKDRLDERILESPSFAVKTAVGEIIHMGNFTLNSVRLASRSLIEGDKAAAEKVLENEQIINQYERMLTEYLVKIENLSLNEVEHLTVKNLLYTANDIERVGDHSENIAEMALQMIQEEGKFSPEGVEDMRLIISQTILSLEKAMEARETEDITTARFVEQSEAKVDRLEEELREKHIKRLSAGLCEISNGVVFLDVLSNLERISDHALNISGYVKSEDKG